jgi:hypothetical protein
MLKAFCWYFVIIVIITAPFNPLCTIQDYATCACQIRRSVFHFVGFGSSLLYNGRGELPPRWPRDAPLSAKVSTKILPTSGGRSFVIVRLQTKSHGVCVCLGRQLCVQPPAWRKRSLYLCLPVKRHRVPFSSLSTTCRDMVF